MNTAMVLINLLCVFVLSDSIIIHEFMFKKNVLLARILET